MIVLALAVAAYGCCLVLIVFAGWAGREGAALELRDANRAWSKAFDRRVRACVYKRRGEDVRLQAELEAALAIVQRATLARQDKSEKCK